MTQEEKLEEAKRLYKTANADQKYVLERLFPELKESEDELTWLTKYIEEEAYYLSMDIRGNEDRIKLENLRKSLALLEKQGEQKSLDNIAKEVIKDKDTATSFLKSCGIMNENGELADEYKIEQGEQNPAWSEDEFAHIVGYLVQDVVANEHMPEEEKQPTKFFVEKYYNKLRPQSQWKPSEEQLRELHCVISGCSFETPILVELEEQLKKL